MPTSMIAAISNVVATGRRMNGRDGLIERNYAGTLTHPSLARRDPPPHCVALRERVPSAAGRARSPAPTERGGSLRAATPLAALPFTRRLGRSLTCGCFRIRPPRPALAGRGLRLSLALVARRTAVELSRRRQGDLGAVAQPVGAVDDDAFTELQPGQDRDTLAIARTEIHFRDRHRIVWTDQIDERPGRTTLDRRDRYDIRIVHRVDEKPDIDELVGEQDLCFIVEYRAEFDGSGGRIDLVIDSFQCAGAELGRSGAIKRADGQRRSGAHLFHYRRQIVLCQGENYRYRLQLGDHDDAVRVTGLHVIARVDLTQPDPAGHRRNDAAIGEVELLYVDLRLIRFDSGLILGDERHLRVSGLPGDRVLRHQRIVPFEVELGILQQGLVLGELRFGLLERHLIGSRIDLGEEVALLDHLALLEGDLGQIAVDLGFDRDRRERGDRPELAQRDRHVAFLHRNHPDRHRTAGARAAGFFRLYVGAGKVPQGCGNDHHYQQWPEKSP